MSREELGLDGWLPFYEPGRYWRNSPFLHDFVWLHREGWPEAQKVDPRALDPTMNAIGLLFKPVTSTPGATP